MTDREPDARTTVSDTQPICHPVAKVRVTAQEYALYTVHDPHHFSAHLFQWFAFYGYPHWSIVELVGSWCGTVYPLLVVLGPPGNEYTDSYPEAQRSIPAGVFTDIPYRASGYRSGPGRRLGGKWLEFNVLLIIPSLSSIDEESPCKKEGRT